MVEAIELLLEADQSQPAHNLSVVRTRSGENSLWLVLSAMGLGSRVSAFVANPARQAACSDRLTSSRYSRCLNEVGL